MISLTLHSPSLSNPRDGGKGSKGLTSQVMILLRGAQMRSALLSSSEISIWFRAVFRPSLLLGFRDLTAGHGQKRRCCHLSAIQRSAFRGNNAGKNIIFIFLSRFVLFFFRGRVIFIIIVLMEIMG